MPANFVEIVIKARDSAKPDLTDLKAKLDDLANRVATATVEVADKAAQATLARLNLQLALLDKKVASPRIDLVGALRAQAQVAALDLALGRLNERSAGRLGGGGFFSRLFGTAAGSAVSTAGGQAAGGAAGTAGLAGSAGVIAGIVASVTALLSGLGGLLPALAAAGMGVTAFGALAYPTISKVVAGVSALGAATTQAGRNKAWAAIPEAMRPLVRSVQDLMGVWDKMSAKLAPAVLKIFNEGLKIANKLLPDMLPFARAAATAIDGLLKGFDKFASSPGFKSFMDSMLKLVGPTITMLGQGMGKVAVGLMRLLQGLITPDALRLTGSLLAGLGNTLSWLGDAAAYLTPRLGAFFRNVSNWSETTYHALGHVISNLEHAWNNVSHVWQNISHAWDNLMHASDNVGHAFFRMGIDIKNWAVDAWQAVNHAWQNISHAWDNIIHAGGDVITWFKLLPGRIVSALGNVGSLLFGAGRAIVQGLIGGMLSQGGPLGAAVRGLAGMVTSGLSGLLGIHSPSTVTFRHGQAIMDGLIAGIESRRGALRAQLAAVGGDIGRWQPRAVPAGAGAMGALAGGGPAQIVLRVEPAAFRAWLKHDIRVHGGDPGVIGR